MHPSRLLSSRPHALKKCLCILATTCLIAMPASHTLAEDAATTAPSSCTDCACSATNQNNNTSLITTVASTRHNHDSVITGTVQFTKTEKGIHIVADIAGLQPNATHGFHVHQFGDTSADDGTSAGGHFNPDNHDHALPHEPHRHAGDLGNLITDENGNAHYENTVDNLTLTVGPTAILGRAVIIHAKPDDGGQPTGNAGARIAIGVIGYAKN